MRRSKGFTLVELMIAVIVVGLLSALSINQYQSAVRKAKVKEPLTILRSLYVAMSAYYYEYGVTYAPRGTYSYWLEDNTALPGLGWKLPTGKKRFRYMIYGDQAGNFWSGVAYAICIWYPPDIDYNLAMADVSARYTGGWWGGGYYLTYLALDLDGSIYGWSPDGQPLTLDSQTRTYSP